MNKDARKKNLKANLIPLGIVVFLIFACILYAHFQSQPLWYAHSLLKVSIPKGTTVVTDVFEEPSFPLGDGYSWMVLQIPIEKAGEFAHSLEASTSWKPLPLPAELAGCEHSLQPTMADLEGTIPIAESSGYYFFVDAQEEHNKKHESQDYDTQLPFCERKSLNFRFALFNVRDGRVYIWSIDT